METKIPTLEEVKAHFKNAKEIKRFLNNEPLNISDFIDNIEFNMGNYYVFVNDWFHTVWSNSKGYAEIISYKEEKRIDRIVESVINQFKERSEVGIKKYNTTLDRTDLNTLDWINHAQQEAMDFVLYLEKLKKEYENNGNA